MTRSAKEQLQQVYREVAEEVLADQPQDSQLVDELAGKLMDFRNVWAADYHTNPAKVDAAENALRSWIDQTAITSLQQDAKLRRKPDLIREVEIETGLSRTDVTKAVNAFLAAIQETLAHNGEVSISGFGSFKVVESSARKGRNLRTGEPIKISRRRSPSFKPGTPFKRAIEIQTD